jgi:hypothetical protein
LGRGGGDFVLRERQLLFELWRRRGLARPALAYAGRGVVPGVGAPVAPMPLPGAGYGAGSGGGYGPGYGYGYGQGPALGYGAQAASPYEAVPYRPYWS